METYPGERKRMQLRDASGWGTAAPPAKLEKVHLAGGFLELDATVLTHRIWNYLVFGRWILWTVYQGYVVIVQRTVLIFLDIGLSDVKKEVDWYWIFGISIGYWILIFGHSRILDWLIKLSINFLKQRYIHIQMLTRAETLDYNYSVFTAVIVHSQQPLRTSMENISGLY